MRVSLLTGLLRFAKVARMELNQYISAKGRGAVSRLAQEIGAHIPDVSRWASKQRPVPEKFAVAVERATGGAVTRKELRPDDWQEIWPELIDLEA